jgi:glucose-6-phosphate isomerase
MEKNTVKGNTGMPFGADVNVIHGIMKNPDSQLVRLASSMRGHYADAKALEELIARGDPVHYEVFEKTVPQESGNLQFGISKTYPGTVGGECFMTKGHYHAIPGTAEVYLCLRGEGYMLMKLPGGQSAYEKLVPGSVLYVPPFWGHRTVCTGEEPVITFYVYPAEAGHNYGDIEKEGFPVRVFKRAGKIEIVPSRKG